MPRNRYLWGSIVLLGVALLLFRERIDEPPKAPKTAQGNRVAGSPRPGTPPAQVLQENTATLQDPKAQFRHFVREYTLARNNFLDDLEDYRFIHEHDYHILELRLFALAYPETAEKESVALLLDRNATLVDRFAAITTAGILVGKGSAVAEKGLLEVASSKDDPARDAALVQLAEADTEGKHREVYRRRAREGGIGAIDALGRWPDPGSVATLHQVIERYTGVPAPEGIARGMAEISLERISILESPELEKRLATLLAGEAGKGPHWQDWALDVATRRGLLPKILPTLKRGIDIGDAHAVTGLDGPPDLLHPSYVQLTRVRCYDDLLIAYARGGGELGESHTQRLRKFGYLGDPKTRLEEILRDGR